MLANVQNSHTGRDMANVFIMRNGDHVVVADSTSSLQKADTLKGRPAATNPVR